MSERIVDSGRGEAVAISSLQQQRARAEAALRAAHDTFRQLVDRSPFGIYVVDSDFRLVQVSDGAQKVFANVQPLLERDFAEVMRLIWPEPFASEAIGRFRHTLSTGEPYKSARTVERRRDVAETEAYDWRIERIVLPDGRFGVVCHFYDLTDREQILLELRQSEERFRHLADAMPQLVWTADSEGRVDYYNARASDYEGLTRRSDGQWEWRAVVHADDIARTADAWARAVAERQTYHCEHRIRMADGSFRWHLSRAFPPTDGVQRWYGTATDVHDLKAAQLELATSQERMHLAAATAKFGIHDHDAIARRTVWSAELYEITGLSPDDPIGFESILKIAHPDDRERVAAAMARATDPTGDGRFDEEFRIVRPSDGDERWVYKRFRTIFSSNHAGSAATRMTGVLVDVSDRHHADELVRESEERFRTLADNMSQLAWMADSTGWLFWYNKRWFEYTGSTLEEMRGDGWRKVHDPDHLERVAEKYRRHVDAGEEWEDTFPLRGVDGTYRWFLSRAKPIRDARGRVLRWFGTNTDVTEQRNLEQALKEAGQRKDEFLATLAHELRNPLAAINGAVQIVRRRGDDADRRAHATDVLQRQVKHLARLIDDLMDVSRVSRGKVTLQMEDVDLRSAVSQALETARPLAEEKQLSLHSSVPDEAVIVRGDAARLLQIVGNLLNNACKFTEPGGRVEVLLEAAKSMQQARIVVRDTGIGIPPDKIADVFELFAQLDTSMTRTNAGLGIGLSLVRDLVQMHGGSIAAHSDGTGTGSTFTVLLPTRRTLQPAPVGPTSLNGQPHSKSPAAAGLRRRVLVVDDNRDSSDALAELLAMSGFEVTRAHDGPGALEQYKRAEPDAVVLDLGLPGIDGREVARRIRANSTAKRPFMVALTGWGQEDDRRKSAEAGFDRHLVKPCDLDALVELLRADAKVGQLK